MTEPGNEGETRGSGPGEYGGHGRDSRAFTEVLGRSQNWCPPRWMGALLGPGVSHRRAETGVVLGFSSFCAWSPMQPWGGGA